MGRLRRTGTASSTRPTASPSTRRRRLRRRLRKQPRAEVQRRRRPSSPSGEIPVQGRANSVPGRGRHRPRRKRLCRRHRRRHRAEIHRRGQILDFAGARTGHEPGQLSSPVGLAVGPSGKVFVADAGNDRIEVFGKLSAPEYGRTVNVSVVSGEVFVKLPGSSKYIELGGRPAGPGRRRHRHQRRPRATDLGQGAGGRQPERRLLLRPLQGLQPKGGKPITVLKLMNALNAAGPTTRAKPPSAARATASGAAERATSAPKGVTARRPCAARSGGRPTPAPGPASGSNAASSRSATSPATRPEAAQGRDLPGAGGLMRSPQLRRIRLLGLLGSPPSRSRSASIAYATDALRALELTASTPASRSGARSRRPTTSSSSAIDDKTFSELDQRWPFPRTCTPR